MELFRNPANQEVPVQAVGILRLREEGEGSIRKKELKKQARFHLGRVRDLIPKKRKAP